MSPRSFVALLKLALAIFLLGGGPASAADLKVLSATGVRSSLEELVPQFERAAGHKVTVDYDASGGLKRRIDAGEAFDVTILTPMALEDVVKSGKVLGPTRATLGRSGMGFAAKPGAPKLETGSAEGLKRALIGAKSIAYAPDGVTAAHLLRVIERLGIASEVKPKLKPYKNAEHVMRAVADGEVELSFSGAPAILAGRGVQLVGQLPSELQDWVVYTAALSATAKNADGGKALIRFLTSERAGAVMKAKGLQPAAPR